MYELTDEITRELLQQRGKKIMNFYEIYTIQ